MNQIVRNGSRDQKLKYLPEMIKGNVIGGLAMTESEGWLLIYTIVYTRLY